MIKATKSAIGTVRQFLVENKTFESFKVTMHDTENNKMRTMTMWFSGGLYGDTNRLFNGYVTHIDGYKIDAEMICGKIHKNATDREIAAFLILSWGIATNVK